MNIFIDTNILIRLFDSSDSSHLNAVKTIAHFIRDDIQLCISSQILMEYWVVATRPKSSNGMGLSVENASEDIDKILRLCQRLTDIDDLFDKWYEIVKEYQVSGKPSHDVKIIAIMQAYEITHLMTFNVEDFKRYTGIEIINPSAF